MGIIADNHKDRTSEAEVFSQELRDLEQFVLWRYVDGKKVPFKPHHTGSMARTNMPGDWSSYQHARYILEHNRLMEGVGFVFHEDDPYCGIDFDGCRNPATGEIDPWVRWWLHKLGGYYEVSPSGTGIKVWVKAKLAGKGKNEIVEGHSVEVYDRGRYFAITHQALPGSGDPEDAQEVVDELYGLLLEAEKARKSKNATVSNDGGRTRTGPSAPADYSQPIPHRQRNTTLFSIAGRLHDGTRTAEELFKDLMTINTRCCKDPGPLDAEEVQDIARRVHLKDPCRPGVAPGVDEVLKAAGAYWYAKLLPKGGQSKLRDVYRAHIAFAGRHGKLVNIRVNGEARRAVRFTASCRQLAPMANTSPMSVSRNTKRLKVIGAMRGDVRQAEDDGATLLIVEPAQNCYTPSGVCGTTPVGGCNTFARHQDPPRPDHLKTPAPRWRDPVGNARAGTLYVLEAFGQQTREEIAERLDMARPRDLQRRHLEPLLELGLVERHGDEWCLPGEYVQKTAEVRQIPYTLARKVRHVTSEGRVICEVMYDEEASVEDRNQADKERYAKNTIEFREWLEGKRKRERGNRFTDEDMWSRREHPVSDLERIEEPPQDLVEALRERPWLREHYVSWIVNYLWSEEIVPYKPTPGDVEVALYEVRHGRQAA